VRVVDFGAEALLFVVLAGLVSGAASVWFMKVSSKEGDVRAAANRIIAHIFEFRLFADEPALILRAQWDLMAANGRLLRCLALPSLFLILPFGALIVAGEGVFGIAPLEPGQSAVLTVQCRRTEDAMARDIQLDAPSGIVVETPAVRIPSEAQLCWRVRALLPVAGSFQIRSGRRLLTKSVDAGGGLQIVSDFRAGTLWSFWAHPLELPFSDPVLLSIRLQYPAATVFHAHWLVWFFLASLPGSLLAMRFG
jgi:hypothetical protein